MHGDILADHIEDLSLLLMVDTSPHLGQVGLEVVRVVYIPELFQLRDVRVLASETFRFLELDFGANHALGLPVVLSLDAVEL